jgi:PhnB protein
MTTTSTKAASGAHTKNGLPHGSTSLTPHLVVKPAADALEFYEQAFGARVLYVTRFPGSEAVAHAELDFRHGKLTLSDPLEAYGLIAPDPSRGTSVSLALYVESVDDVTARAVARGATLREPVTTFVSGDRYSSILDPFGVRWAIMTRVEDISSEESHRRVEEWSKSQGKS